MSALETITYSTDTTYVAVGKLDRNIQAVNTAVEGILRAGTVVPSGIICAFRGQTAPAGWALCNGQNGTPDLRDRFIVGMGSEHLYGSSGGRSAITETLPLPPHSHEYLKAKVVPAVAERATNIPARVISSCALEESDTSLSGSSASIEWKCEPPFYALAYVMKL